MRRCHNRSADPQVSQVPLIAELPDDAPQEWLPLETAPYGTVIQVSGAGENERALAIRDASVGWYDENRSGGIQFTPTGWAPIC